MSVQTLNPGQTYVHGKDPATARALLDACDRVGVDRTVPHATDSGFIVPDAVADEWERDTNTPTWAPEGSRF